VIAARTGQKLDLNQQCLSEGAANFAGSFFQCFPGSGSLTRSAVNQQAGAVSQWSGVFAAGAVAATVVLFAPLVEFIPRASLTALLLLAAYRMIDGGQLLFHLRATRFDAGVVLATAATAVLISVELCIVIGVFLSFALYVPRAARVRLVPLTPTRNDGLRDRRAGDPACERLIAFGLEGEMFFGAEAELVKHFETISRSAGSKVGAIVLSLRRARNSDASFLLLLRQMQENYRSRGIALLLCDVGPDMMSALAATGLDAAFGAGRIFPDEPPDEACGVRAVDFAFELVDGIPESS
jgi:SulP family sulfate permease